MAESQPDSTASAFLASPHSDDIALSLGGWLSACTAQANARLRLTICLVFSRSQWAPFLPPSTELEISETRRGEERRIACKLGVPLIDGRQLDASCVGLDAVSELRQEPRKDPRWLAVRHFVHVTIPPRAMVWAPLAIGHHVDHLMVRDAVCERGGPVALYEDLPYACNVDARQIPKLAEDALQAEVNAWVTRPLNAAALDGKHQLLRQYRSQLSSEDIQQVMDYTCGTWDDRAPRERVWTAHDDLEAGALLERLGFIRERQDCGLREEETSVIPRNFPLIG